MSLGRLAFGTLLINLSLILSSYGMEVYVDSFKVGPPTYFNDSRVKIKLNTEEIDHEYFSSSAVKISYLKNNNVFYQTLRELTQNEVDSCVDGSVCELTQDLKNGFEEATCSVKVEILTRAEVVIAHSRINWGHCLSQSSREVDLKMDQVFLSANILTQELPEEIRPNRELNFSNLDNFLEYVLIGKDHQGRTIYSDRKYPLFSTNTFNNLLSPKQYEQLCWLELYVDPYGKNNDIFLENNIKEFKLGHCIKGRRERFSDLSISRYKDLLYVYNLNHVVFPAKEIELSFQIYDQNENETFRFFRSISGSLGFFEYSVYDFSHLLTDQNCKIVVGVNPSRKVFEKDFNNNLLVINHCLDN